MNLRCRLGIHKWIEDYVFGNEDEDDIVLKSFHCKRCGLVKEARNESKMSSWYSRLGRRLRLRR
jgi:hypothetical protein